jgi:hypothetical protein
VKKIKKEKPTRAEIKIDCTLECSLCNTTVSWNFTKSVEDELFGYEAVPTYWSTIYNAGKIPFLLCDHCSARLWDAIQRGDAITGEKPV